MSGEVVEEIETHHLFVDDQRVLLVDDVISTDNAKLGVGKLLRYQYGNHLGSVALELDETAQIIGYEEFHPYGTTAYHLASLSVRATAKRFRYTGMERDEETGLSYHTARFYAPWLGRWVSVDPLSAIGGGSIYEYANDQPIHLIDRTGKQATTDWDLRLANWLDDSGVDDAAAGFGDMLTFGVTSDLRRATGTDQSIDRSSGAYAGGQAGGLLVQTVLLGGAAAASAPAIGRTVQAGVTLVRTNPIGAVVAGGEFAVGLADPHPPGLSPLDLPGPFDDAGRAVRAALRTEGRVTRSAAARAEARIMQTAQEVAIEEVAVDVTARETASEAAHQSTADVDPELTIVDVVDALTREQREAVAAVEDHIRAGDTSSLDDLLRNRRGTSPRTAHLLATDANGALTPSSRFFGQAAELELRRRIRSSPVLRQYVTDGTYMSRQPEIGGRIYRGFTDFQLNVGGTSLAVDLTTSLDAAAHHDRFYGENMLVLRYDFPF